MKRGIKTFSLAMSVTIIAGVLASCSSDYTYPDADWQDNIIVTVGGKSYTYNEIFELFEGEQASAEAYYETAKNVLAQIVTPVNSVITSRVDALIEEMEDTWEENAQTNGTSYREEREATFEEEHVDDMDEYRAKLTAQVQNEVNSEAYYTDTTGEDTEYGGLYYISEDDTKEFVEKEAPYHVSHILVQLDADSASGGTGIWDGHISADDAMQIGNVVSNLASSTTFGNVARIFSDDSSADSYGDLGGDSGASMSKTTSYVNEFKLGIYAYDAFINPATKNQATVKSSLQVPGENEAVGEVTDSPVSSEISSTQVGQGKAYGIPVSVAFRLYYVANQERADDGTNVSYTDETQYPRNILFNNYFNNHSVCFLYDDSDDYATNFLAELNAVYGTRYESIAALRTAAESNTALYYRLKEYDYVSAQLAAMSESKFANFNGVSDNLVAYTYESFDSTTATISSISSHNILVDEDGEPIMVTRAGSSSASSDDDSSSGYEGIHFIVVKEDPFVEESGQESYKYWRVNIPSTDDDATTAESTDYSTYPSYVNYINADYDSNSAYTSRIQNVRTSISASDENYDFKLYEKNLSTYQSTYNTSFYETLGENQETVEDIIQRYIDYTRETSENSNEDSLDSSWETYIRQLNLYEDYAPKRVVPTVCVSYFQSGSYGDNDEMEALCHVER